jgi:hypothetical protein
VVQRRRPALEAAPLRDVDDGLPRGEALATTTRAHDSAGLRLSVFGISRNAKYYVHTYARLLSDLYLVEGLK